MNVIDWKSPTTEMLAAVALARQCSARGGLNEVGIAEMIIGAKESLWYLQASEWAESAPSGVEGRSAEFFKVGCQTIVKIVDLGYDAASNRWWNLKRLYPDETDWHAAQIVLMDTGAMLGRLPNVALPSGGDVPAFTIVSGGFSVFLSIVLGPRWEKRYEAIMAAMQQGARLKSGARRRG